MPYLPNTEHNRRSMLEAIDRPSVEEIFEEVIPPNFRLKRDLQLPSPLSEPELLRELSRLSGLNRPASQLISFLGAGIYDHYVPPAVWQLAGREEFYTTYTPYQPEVSQGTLQALYEYQSLICRLTGMEVANASVYDGANALAEAVLMLYHSTQKPGLLLSETIHPSAREVVRTYIQGLPCEEIPVPSKDGVTDLEALDSLLGQREDLAVFCFQQPNFFGCLEPLDRISALLQSRRVPWVVSVDPISLGLLKPPGDYGADVVIGEGQALGTPMNYGGPLVGFFATRSEYLRRIPGRLIGLTVDRRGERGFVMTLQTREQHIRREKATSNICTSESLLAIASAIYLSLLGPRGLRQVARLCLQKAHYLAKNISQIPGFRLAYPQPFFKEFVVECPLPTQRLLQDLLQEGILAGCPLERFFPSWENRLLVCVTEKRTREEMDRFLSALSKYAR